MEIEKANKLKKGDEVIFANHIYTVAKIKQFPHGIMVGIYDESKSNHVDYIQPKTIKQINNKTDQPCNNCQGCGCPVCNGTGLIN